MNFNISASPHLRDDLSISKIMYAVILTLIPAGAWSVYIFGLKALWLILIAILSAIATEWICQKLMRRPITLYDGSAILTGLLLAYNLPPCVPLWIPAVGAFVGIFIGKQIFGGLGYNPMNPALIGRAFLMASWPVHMTVFKTIPNGEQSLSGIDCITGATPLTVFKEMREILINRADFLPEQVTQANETMFQLNRSYWKLFFGNTGGCIGEVSAFLILLGASYLLYRRIIGWKIPLSYIGTVAILTTLFGGTNGLFTGNALFHILSGGLFLGAFYMATDMVTTPVTFYGRLLFGFGCGVLTVIIRLWGGYPEGVSYSILLMNLTTPLLDRYTKPKVFGS
ncbi:RnfABCDGE type electron transport complex subunit D [bacterium]|nr:RnfABCDGE type electron transport complex subunit D [bacterium]